MRKIRLSFCVDNSIKSMEYPPICSLITRTVYPEVPPRVEYVLSELGKSMRPIDISDDFFFKGAPLVIVISSTSSINAGLASAYMELMANSLGLGVLYSGFFVACTKLSRKLRNLLDLPKGHAVVSCLVIGYAADDVKYQRIPPRRDAQAKVL